LVQFVGELLKGHKVKTVWTAEANPKIFENTGRTYSVMSLEELEDRGFLTPQIKAIVASLPEGAWLAGSWFESIFRGETPKDFDIFFSGEKALKAMIEVISEQDELDEDEDSIYIGYEVPDDELIGSLLDSATTTAITIGNTNKERPPIQLIKARTYQSAAEVIDSFDFTVCQFAIDAEGMTFNPAGMLDLVRKRLVLHRMTFPSENESVLYVD